MEVKVVQLGDQDFRVEAQGLSVLLTLAVSIKVCFVAEFCCLQEMYITL